MNRQTPHLPWPGLAVLSAAMLLPSMGTSIVNVALPDMAHAFGADFPAVQWVVLAYLLTLSAFIVGAGRLGDMLGRRRLLMAGFAVFAAASVAGALAPALWAVIAARAVQGLGAALLTALAIASVGDLVPKDRTGSAMGLMGTVSAIGTALGPSLGGALVALWGWPAVFAVLATLAVAAGAAARRVLPADRPSPGPLQFDTAGLVLLATALAALALAFAPAGAASVAGPALPAIAGAAALAFLWVETRAPHPLIRLGLLADRPLAAGLATSGLVATVLMSTLVVGPFFLSLGLGLDALHTGLVMSVGPAVSALCGVPAGRAVDRFGALAVTRLGLGLLVLGSVLMALVPVRFGWPGYAASLAVMTAGYALFQASNNTAVMARAGGEQRGLVSGLLGLARNMGLIAGASAMGALFAWGSAGGLAWLGAGAGAGLQLTFAAAAGLALLAFGITQAGRGA